MQISVYEKQSTFTNLQTTHESATTTNQSSKQMINYIFNLVDFKGKINDKTIADKHFCLGSKLGNTLVTRLGYGRSGLNLHTITLEQHRQTRLQLRHYLPFCFLKLLSIRNFLI